MRTNVLIPLVVILVPLAFVVSCTVSEQGATESSDGEQATSEETAAGLQGSTSATGSAAGSESPTGEATLEIQGNPGTEFSGTCTVGEEVNEIGRQAPGRFTYQLDGQRIECEIRQESAGSLGLVFTAGASTSSVQQINAQGGTINLVYENGSLSSFSSSG